MPILRHSGTIMVVEWWQMDNDLDLDGSFVVVVVIRCVWNSPWDWAKAKQLRLDLDSMGVHNEREVDRD